MIIAHDTTIVVADGGKMRLFRNKGVEPEIRLIKLPDPDIDPGNQGSGSRHRSAPANPDGARMEEDNFAAAAANYLNRHVLDGAIAGVFIIADPRTLGEMRRHLHDAVKARLVGELAKDLTGHPVETIEAALVKA